MNAADSGMDRPGMDRPGMDPDIFAQFHEQLER